MSDVPKEIDPPLRRRVLRDQSVVPFVQLTPEYGVAWFNFCPIFRTVKRGQPKRVTGLYIFPRQQPDAQEFYEVEDAVCETFRVDSWTHRGIASPRVWQHLWCPEHQCVSLCVYAPDRSNCFMLSVLPSALAVTFSDSIL